MDRLSLELKTSDLSLSKQLVEAIAKQTGVEILKAEFIKDLLEESSGSVSDSTQNSNQGSVGSTNTSSTPSSNVTTNGNTNANTSVNTNSNRSNVPSGEEPKLPFGTASMKGKKPSELSIGDLELAKKNILSFFDLHQEKLNNGVEDDNTKKIPTFRHILEWVEYRLSQK